MENPVLGQQFKALLLGTAGLLVAILIGWQIGSADYKSLIIGVIITLGASFALFSGRFFWVVTIASSFLAGTFPILGGSFTPFQILMAIGVAKFIIEDIVLRRTRLKLGNRFDLLLLCGFMVILTWHGIHDRFGMRFLGSNVWGGRNYLNVYVGLAAFFVIQSIPMNPKTWSKLPYLVFAVAAFDLLIGIVTTIFPESIYTIYPFYSAVSTAGITEILTGDTVQTARLGPFGSFGGVLILLVLASFSIRQIFKPPMLLRPLILAVGSLAVLFSSFRSALLNTVAIVFAAGIRDLKGRILLFVPILAALLLGASVINSEVIRLPKQIQRSLAFIPGDWDTEMKFDVAASNDFRRRVWTVFSREFFPERPLLGRGFGFQSQWAMPSVYKNDPYADRQTVEVGNIHNGFLSSLDAWGIVGTIFFVAWNLRLLARTFQVTFSHDDPYGMPLRFLALLLGAAILCFWIGAPSVGSFLPREFALAGVFLQLQRAIPPVSIRRKSAVARAPVDVPKELAST